MLGESGTSSLSFHCQDREVIAGSVNPASRCVLLFKEQSNPELSHKPLNPVLAWNGRVSK